MQPHPYADLFPMMDKKTFQGLVASIRDDGLENPIVTFEGKILDGRNRDLACANAQVKPVYVPFKGKDALAFVLRANLTRRHLTASQRAMVAAKMANMKSGANKTANVHLQQPVPLITVKEAADTLDVSTASVTRAKAVQASGDEELIEAVESGEVPVAVAAKKIKGATTPTTPTRSAGEVESQRLLNLWDKTGAKGRKLFLDGIGVS